MHRAFHQGGEHAGPMGARGFGPGPFLMHHLMHGQSPVDFLFAQADTNKDGKLSKDEVANFVWSHLSKADADHDNAVTKDELKAFAKQRFAAMRAEHVEKSHKHHAGHKKSNPAVKPADKPAPEKPKAETKPDAKAEVTPTLKSPSNSQSKVEVKGSSKPAVKAAGLERVNDPKAGTLATQG